MIRAKVVEKQSSSEVIRPTLQEDGSSETIPFINNSETEAAKSNNVNASNMDTLSSEKPMIGLSSVELLRQNLHDMVLSSAVGLFKVKDVIAFKVRPQNTFFISEQIIDSITVKFN